MYRGKYFSIIEIKVPANAAANKSFTFETQSQLQTIIGDQRVIIEAIEVYTDTAITHSPITSGNPVATAADIQNACLTLMFGTFEAISQMPLASLCRILPDQNTYSPAVVELALFRDMMKIDWTKSKITLLQAAPTTSAFSYLFGVYYDYLPVQ